MNSKFLVLPALALVAAGVALCEARNVTEHVRVPVSGSRLVSRTMPPSDPKPDGPKKPRLSGTRPMLPQGLA
jgi:hypothetical protein